MASKPASEKKNDRKKKPKLTRSTLRDLAAPNPREIKGGAGAEYTTSRLCSAGCP